MSEPLPKAPDGLAPEPTSESANVYAELAATQQDSPDVPPHSQTDVDAQMAKTEAFLGLDKDVKLEDVAAQVLARERNGQAKAEWRIKELFEANDIDLDPVAAPTADFLKSLTPEDWEAVRTSESPLLTLYAATNYRLEVWRTGFVPAGRPGPLHSDPRTGPEGIRNEAMIASVPLIHGLTTEAFMKLAEGGVMQSNRSRFEASGADALTFHGAGVGATNILDREFGLDKQVFFDFGRPARHHQTQPEITLVVDPVVMDQPGVFMTEKDIYDTSTATSPDKIEEYMNGLSTPKYFRDTALLKICNTITERGESGRTGYSIYNNVGGWRRGADGVDFMGNKDFSTYEVKIPDPPGVPTSAIRRVVVRDQETFEHLQQTLGDRFEFVHEPKLRARGGIKPDFQGDARSGEAIDQGNYPEVLQIPGAYEAKLEQLIETDYLERRVALDSLSDDDKEQAVMVFANDPDVIDGEDIETRIDTKTNPYRHLGLIAEYTNMQALHDDVDNTHNLREYDTAAGQAPWFHNPLIYSGEKAIQTTSGSCVVVVVERSKQNPRITRILGVQSFSLAEA